MKPRLDGRYAREFLAGWGSMDFNGHLANTAYLDLAADVRMAFFAEHGFPPALLAAMQQVPPAPGFVELSPVSGGAGVAAREPSPGGSAAGTAAAAE